MTVELQEAPTIEDATVLDIPEMIAHIYEIGKRHALCGLDRDNDPHHLMHRAKRLPPDRVIPNSPGCGCGAPVCETCYARFPG